MTIADVARSSRTMVGAGDLRDALTACLLSAGKDSFLPSLMSVQIEKRAGELVFRSTDRFRLTRVTVTLDSDDMPSPDWRVLVSVADVKRVLSTVPKPRRNGSDSPVALSWLDDGGRDAGGHAVNGLSLDIDGAGVRVQSIDADYPRVDSLIPTDDSDTVQMGEVLFDPARMADLCKMPGRGKNEAVSLRLRGDRKGLVSEWGSETVRFVHLLMPCRKTV